MSFLDQDYSTVYDEEVLAEDSEIKLRVTSAEVNNVKHYVLVTLCDPANDKMKEVRQFLFLPKPEDEPKKINNKKKDLQRFEECFNCSGITLENIESELAGHEGWVILKKEEDATYGASNAIKRYIGQKKGRGKR